MSRFASSVDNFKAVLWRKVERRGLPDGTDDAVARAWIDALAEKFTGLGLLDDAVFARARAGSLFRRGKPQRVIQSALVAKGVAPDVAADAVATLAETSADPDFDAAVAFARRKRLGPYARTTVDADGRRKELASFARAGFSYQIARKVLDASSDDAA